MGYDRPKSLGEHEFGAQLALPIWTNYMRHALRGVSEYKLPMPAGIVKINNELYFRKFTPGNGFIESISSITDKNLVEIKSDKTSVSVFQIKNLEDKIRSILKMFSSN
jgi:penicillin-binding protein 1A